MRLIAVATGAIALLSLAAGTPARAADLGYGDYSDRYRSAYEDSRYRDLYGPPPARVERRYVEKEEIEERYAEVDDDFDDKRLAPPARVYRFSDRSGYDCTPRRVIRDRLYREGWHDFHEIDLRNGVAIVEARRPNGLPYRLKIDRCSGDVVSARPLGPVPRGPYAYGPRRYYGPYLR
jgi:hypothetical protein